MRTLPSYAVIACLLAAPLAAEAGGTTLEPGLWETTAKTEMVGMPFTPPVQTHRSCLSKEQIEHPWSRLQANKSQDCKFTNVKVEERSASWEMQCDNQGGHMTGKGTTTFVDSKHMHGVIHMVMQANGRQMKMNIETHGHWLSAACPK
ncbi:MAG TPA: DUF3617 domain-containing protein [Gammaproteobacteria bacterium]|nr:DUF3617 domain-containing protein [Gammaproteobacteria bacterium]